MDINYEKQNNYILVNEEMLYTNPLNFVIRANNYSYLTREMDLWE